MLERVVTITNDEGLHARPAGIFVKQASQFKCQIEFVFKGKKVNAKSIMSLMGLGIEKGHEITLIASGEDEVQAMEALTKLIAEGFKH
jgi:phosphocarrier protein